MDPWDDSVIKQIVQDYMELFKKREARFIPSLEATQINELPKAQKQERLELLVEEAAFWNKYIIDFIQKNRALEAIQSSIPSGKRYLEPKGIEWEVACLSSAFKKVCLSDYYIKRWKEKNDEFVDTLFDQPWFIPLAQDWPNLSQEQALEGLRKISTLRDDIYGKDKDLPHRKTIVRFMDKSRHLKAIKEGVFAHAYYSPKENAHITEFNPHNRSEFGNFLRTTQTLQHEGAHGDQGILIRAFEQEEITDEHPLYSDAYLLHAFYRGAVEYTGSIHEIYDGNIIERDAEHQHEKFTWDIRVTLNLEGIEIPPPNEFDDDHHEPDDLEEPQLLLTHQPF